MGSLTFLMSGVFPAPIMSWLLWRCFKRAGYSGIILTITLFPLLFSILDALPKTLEMMDLIPARQSVEITTLQGDVVKVPDPTPRYKWLTSRIPFYQIVLPILFWFPFLFLAIRVWPISRESNAHD